MDFKLYKLQHYKILNLSEEEYEDHKDFHYPYFFQLFPPSNVSGDKFSESWYNDLPINLFEVFGESENNWKVYFEQVSFLYEEDAMAFKIMVG